MADAREHEQPGTVPAPQHDRRTPRPRGQDTAGDARQAADGTLAWSLIAMSDALRRLAAASAADIPQAVAAATEAVWWVTLADAAMTRCHPGAYGTALAALDPAARRAVEGSFAGLRFVRGQLGYHADPGDFIQPQPAPGGGTAPPSAWTWASLPPLPPHRGTAREASPYREYRAELDGRPLSQTLARAADFLSQAHATTGRAGHRGSPQPPGRLVSRRPAASHKAQSVAGPPDLA
jgi:hypothetical protein